MSSSIRGKNFRFNLWRIRVEREKIVCSVTYGHPYISKHQEWTKEKKNDNKQLPNVENEQYDSSGDVQYLDGQNHKQIYVSRHALKFAVDERFSPLRTQIEASALVKELLKQIEQKFKKLNPRYNNPLGFDHYMIDENGDLVWFTKYIELFIFLCDNSNYPTQLTAQIFNLYCPTAIETDFY